MELDNVDVTIVNALMDDACRSLRSMSKVTGLSAPAISSRLKKLRDAGIITGTTVKIDRGKLNGGVTAVLLIKCDVSKLDLIADKLYSFEEITEAFRLTGSYGILAKAEADDINSMNNFVDMIERIEGITDLNPLIINKYIKETGKPFRRISVNLRCEYCGNTIAGKPFTIEFRGVTRFLCCPTCMKEYRNKYGI
ncbi:MAG: Lrp/AsnC ligand binding domain-containing protein [Nitrososphaerota archaeon]|jgi:DNA-binding Lrp family transcriptional regulator|nr:Lrp/AsnC ligand binding domain-containing protein [Nitrososphaerota archaeon]MDG6927771.1 Lrp/AsnC ligand binding domain-containing protein [Nitrososphaerota archaeon]MDG6930310.1 Lrp/AsnC ligand binding domain-containing protein [Nitrososphaerota archaeon]MDG6932733.1 Lrp/AsnC ligand binding domain-containing protein [Nitrososphaerota archaeon]MDG6935356.1 Lrp/AsnC ligand binding domain-containing protein [Nitrososphaerota archaeon]